MRYIDIGGYVVPKHCKFGPRPAEGLVFNNYEWWSVTDHLVREQREKEMYAVQRAKEEAKKEISFNMTRNWSNTLASIKTLGNQKRQEKREKDKQDKIDQYNQIMKNREEEKKNLLAEVKAVLYDSTDAAKSLKSAVLLSTVLEGREKQIKLKNAVKEKEAAKLLELAEKFKKDAEDFAREKLEEKLKEREKKLKQKQDLDTQMVEIRLRKKAEAEELEEEKQDLINMRIEGEKIRHCNEVEKKYRKNFAAKYIQKTQNQLEYEKNVQLEEEEEDEINKIYINYARRFQKERKEREEKVKKEKIEQRIKIAEKLGHVLEEAVKKEEARLEAAFNEKEKQAMADQQSKEKLKQEALADILKSKKEAEEARAREIYNAKEIKKWEIMQSYRRAEINEEWKMSEKKRLKEMKASTKAGYDQQCKELEEKKAKDLKEWLTPLENLSEEKKDIDKYCQETLDWVKGYNLPCYPVRATIAKIQKEHAFMNEKKPNSEQKIEKEATNNCSKQIKKPRGSGCYCFKY